MCIWSYGLTYTIILNYDRGRVAEKLALEASKPSWELKSRVKIILKSYIFKDVIYQSDSGSFFRYFFLLFGL